MVQPSNSFQLAEYRGSWPEEERQRVDSVLHHLEHETPLAHGDELPPWVCLRVRIPSWGLMYLAMRWNSSRLVRAKSLRGLLHALRTLQPADFAPDLRTDPESFDPAQWALQVADRGRAA